MLNGFNTIETSQGKATSIHDIDGLHKAIGMFLIFHQKDLSGDEISCILKEIFKLEEKLNEIVFKDTKKGWQAAA